MSNRFGIPDSLLDAVRAVEQKSVSKNAAFGETINESELVTTRRADVGVEKVRGPDGKMRFKKKPHAEIKVEENELDEAASPYHKAAAHLEKMTKDPKFKRYYGDDIDTIKNHVAYLKSSDPRDHKASGRSARNHDTIIRDIVSDAVHKNSSKEDSKMWHDAAGLRRLREAMDPVDKKELKGKYADRKDKDIDNDGDADKTDQYLHRRRKAISKAMGEKKDKVDVNPKDDTKVMGEGTKSGLENPHNCATHVYSESWGEGTPVKTMHADPDENGHIAWYDVMFEHGIEKRVPIEELNVLQTEMHNHAKKKEKK